MDRRLQKGYSAEERFILACLERNIPISRPVFNVEPYDFVIEVNNKFKSIQIKTFYRGSKSQHTVELRNTNYSRNGRRAVGYHKDVDYLVIPLNESDWFIIPRRCFKDKTSALIVNPNGKYKSYINKWDFEDDD